MEFVGNVRERVGVSTNKPPHIKENIEVDYKI